MAGMGQYGSDQLGWNAQFSMNRKAGTNMQQQNKKKQGYFGEDEDSEPAFYFNMGSSAFRSDKEPMTSPSPSQLSAFGSNIYGAPSGGGMGNISLPQRGLPNPPFQRNNPGHVTPTSIANFPVGFQQQQQQQQASPNRNVFSAIGGHSAIGGQRGVLNQINVSQAMTNLQKRNNPISSGLLSPNRFSPNILTFQQQQNQRSQNSSSSSGGNPITSMAGFGRSGSNDSSQPSLDLSEFPTLGNRSAIAPPNPLPTPRNYVGMVSKPMPESTPEFTIQQEDFPALPGAQNPPTSSSNSDTIPKSTYNGQAFSLHSQGPMFSPLHPSNLGGPGSYEQALNKEGAKFPGDKSTGSATKRGIQTHPDGTVSNIPHGMVNDQFGMVGLLTFIRAAETDSNLLALAPGIDLTTLGLNLNSPDNLYSTFQSPWADAPCRPQDIDFHVPSEYLTNIYIRDKLAPIKLNRYGEDLLFFLFYMNGGDVLQLAAAAELYNRDWRYHKDDRVWITRAPGMEPVMKTNTYERGTYYFFDATNWRKVAKEFYLEYDKLEEKPHLPAALHHNPNQPNTVLAH